MRATRLIISSSLPMVKGSPINHRHVPSARRRATSIAYSERGSGAETFHTVCIRAMSPDRMICLIAKSNLALLATRGAGSAAGLL